MLNENWLDKTISWVSPHAGARRLYARVMSENARFALKEYDGAAKGRRTKNWRTSNSSVNTEVKKSLAELRNRSRDLIRNEPYARRAGQAIVGNVVGAGIIAKAIAKTEGRSKIFQLEWNAWADSTDCDYEGRNNFYGLQALIMHTVFEAGEVLVKRVRRDSKFGLVIPMQLQILEPDFIDSQKEEKFKNGNFIIQGVEYNSNGKRQAYWLFDKHPGDQGILTNSTSTRIPAEDILHIFKSERAGQVRGIPWLAPVMIKLKDYSDYSDFTLMRQKVSACFTAFVTTPDPMDLASGTQAPPAIGERMEPGLTEQLAQGQSIEFSNPPSAAEWAPFSEAQLMAVAAGLGITFEILTGNWLRVNFSSGRLGWIEFSRNVDMWRWHLLIPHFNVPTWRWFTEAATIAGFGSDRVGVGWTPPRREMIDPAKEVEGLKAQVRGGFMSLSEGIRQNGYEPTEVLNEIADDNKVLDKLGLVLDTDPRKGKDAANVVPPAPPQNDA